MRVFKPEWVRPRSDDKTYMSVAVHPAMTEVACAGDLGVDVWSWRPIADPAAEGDASEPLHLQSLNMHTGTVNIVRYSPRGDLLATAGDDCCVNLMQRIAVGGARGATVEWMPVTTAVRHPADVYGLDFSRDGTIFASCSLDGSLLVHAVDRPPRLVSRTVVQEGALKTCVIDPQGRYVLCQGEHTAYVCLLETGEVVRKIVNPLRHSTPTPVLRACWSPDGSIISLPSAFSNQRHCVTNLSRDKKFSEDVNDVVDFHGSRHPTMCVAASPQRMRTANGTFTWVTAVCGNDDFVSFWVPQQSRPICVVSGLFKASILDAGTRNARRRATRAQC